MCRACRAADNCSGSCQLMQGRGRVWLAGVLWCESERAEAEGGGLAKTRPHANHDGTSAVIIVDESVGNGAMTRSVVHSNSQLGATHLQRAMQRIGVGRL